MMPRISCCGVVGLCGGCSERTWTVAAATAGCTWRRVAAELGDLLVERDLPGQHVQDAAELVVERRFFTTTCTRRAVADQQRVELAVAHVWLARRPRPARSPGVHRLRRSTRRSRSSGAASGGCRRRDADACSRMPPPQQRRRRPARRDQDEQRSRRCAIRKALDRSRVVISPARDQPDRAIRRSPALSASSRRVLVADDVRGTARSATAGGGANSCTGPVASAARSTAWSSTSGASSSTVRRAVVASSTVDARAAPSAQPCRRVRRVDDEPLRRRPRAARRPCRTRPSPPAGRCRPGRRAARPGRAGGWRTARGRRRRACSRSTSLITSTATGSRPGERLVEHQDRPGRGPAPRRAGPAAGCRG